MIPISYMCSPWHKKFIRMGYPQLDIATYKDGSWAIIQYHNTPIIPSMTRFSVVLGPMHNVDISDGFLTKYVRQLDITRKEFWDEEERKSAEAEKNAEKKEEHAKDTAERCTQAVVNNPALMDRIAKNGIEEINLSKIARNIPKYLEPRL